MPVAPAPTSRANEPALLDFRKEKTITAKEAAYRLGKDEDTIVKWLRKGRLKGWQPGGRGCTVLVMEASLEETVLRFPGRAK